MLKLKMLTAGYGGARVLNDVNLSVAPGERLGLVGYNGMGKTSLLRSIVGILPSSSGTISWHGQLINRTPVHARNLLGIAMVAQGCTGFPNLTVKENLLLASLADSKLRDPIIDKVLTQIPRLTRLLKRPSSALSGGERQLLSLARALIGAPKLLLIDEITDGVQPSVCDELSELLNEIVSTEGLSMLIVDQDLSFVDAIAQRSVLMHKGRIAAQLSSRELMSDSPFDFKEVG